MKEVILPYIGQKVRFVEPGEEGYPDMPRHCEVVDNIYYIRMEDEDELYRSFEEFIKTRFF